MNRAQRYIEKARKKVERMDAIDHEHGYATPVDAGQSVQVAMEAIKAGLATSDWDCVAEAYVILEQTTKGDK